MTTMMIDHDDDNDVWKLNGWMYGGTYNELELEFEIRYSYGVASQGRR